MDKLPFKSIYTHQDGFDVDIKSIDTKRFPKFLLVTELVYIDEETTSEVTSVYDYSGMFITANIEIMEKLMDRNVVDFEGVMCPRLAVIGRMDNTSTWCVWYRDYIQTFELGQMPDDTNFDEYLPTNLKNACDVLRDWVIRETGVTDYVVGPKYVDGSLKFCAFHRSSLNDPKFILCEAHSRFGDAKYAARNSDDTKKWAIESTFCIQPELIPLEN